MHLLRIDPYVANEGYVVRISHNKLNISVKILKTLFNCAK